MSQRMSKSNGGSQALGGDYVSTGQKEMDEMKEGVEGEMDENQDNPIVAIEPEDEERPHDLKATMRQSTGPEQIEATGMMSSLYQ